MDIKPEIKDKSQELLHHFLFTISDKSLSLLGIYIVDFAIEELLKKNEKDAIAFLEKYNELFSNELRNSNTRILLATLYENFGIDTDALPNKHVITTIDLKPMSIKDRILETHKILSKLKKQCYQELCEILRMNKLDYVVEILENTYSKLKKWLNTETTENKGDYYAQSF